MPENKHLKFLLIVVYIIIGYFFFTKIFPRAISILMPFILAFIVAAITSPLVKFLIKRIKFPKWLAVSTSLVLILAVLSSVITIAINRIIFEITGLINKLPNIISNISNQLTELNLRWSSIYDGLSPQMAIYLNDFLSNISQTLASMITPLTKFTLSSAKNVATMLPQIFVFIIIFIIATIFMTNDFDYIKKSLIMQIPASIREKTMLIKKYTGIALSKYLKGMSIIMFITFSELLIGFMIIGVEYAFTLAIIVAIIDVLPVFGIGTIVLPWCVFSLISGNYKLAVSLIILYGIITIVRQIIEPKVMSASLGTYPIVTLLAMYIGLNLFGVFGMILGPITMLVLIYLQRSKVIHFWKTE